MKMCFYQHSMVAGCTPPKTSRPAPTLQFGGVFCIDVDQGSLINKKKNEK